MRKANKVLGRSHRSGPELRHISRQLLRTKVLSAWKTTRILLLPGRPHKHAALSLAVILRIHRFLLRRDSSWRWTQFIYHRAGPTPLQENSLYLTALSVSTSVNNLHSEPGGGLTVCDVPFPKVKGASGAPTVPSSTKFHGCKCLVWVWNIAF